MQKTAPAHRLQAACFPGGVFNLDRGAIAEIDLEAVAHNYRLAKKLAKGRLVIAVVKADAYGHGADEVSRRLEKEGASCLAVAYTSEAAGLRLAGIKAPIIVLFDKYNPEDYFIHNLIPVIHDVKTARAFSKEAKKRKRIINVHIKVDTGMGRLGFGVEGLTEKIAGIAKMEFIKIAGVMSHFSDADLSDNSNALMQIERFKSVKDVLIKKGIRPVISHMANSAAVMTLPESHFDAIRPGLMLYGYSPMQLSANLKPAMTVKTKILSLRRFKKGTPVSYGRTFITQRESLIAVLPIGYADGYNRLFSNNADVLIKGKRAPVAGRVCMDTIMIDVTQIKNVSEGDEAVLLGKENNNIITADELALKAKTIPYEILTSFGSKSQKVYLNGR